VKKGDIEGSLEFGIRIFTKFQMAVGKKGVAVALLQKEIFIK